MNKHTPGPWRWEVNLKHHKVELCGGKPEFDKTVMSFVRWGMNGAAPEFTHDDGDYPKLTRCDVLAVVARGREHHKDWFRVIDNPDARLIAAAPDLLEALVHLAAHCEAMEAQHPDYHNQDGPLLSGDLRAAIAAIAKARGET